MSERVSERVSERMGGCVSEEVIEQRVIVLLIE